jgi:acyl carrier protein
MNQLSDEIRQFVVDNFLFGQGADALKNDESFLETGVLDSTGVLQLVGFIERQYNIVIGDDELVPDNLDSVLKAAAFVDRKLRVTS